MERLGVIKSVFRQKLHVVKIISEKTLTQQHLGAYGSEAKSGLRVFPSAPWLSAAFLERVVEDNVWFGQVWEWGANGKL